MLLALKRFMEVRPMGTNSRGTRLGALILLGLGLCVGAVLTSRSAEPPSDVDGLVRVENRQVDHLFVLPAADFQHYSKVRIEPVSVSFSERWQPNSDRSRRSRRLSDQDIENLRSNIATEFHRTVADELMRGGYMVVEEDGDDVLRVTPMIVNLYVAAPSQTIQPGSRVFIANTGHMSLVADVSDSVSGEVLARVVDTQRGRRTGRLELASSVSNMADARAAFRLWATVLRNGLDDARKYPISSGNAPQKEAATEGESTPR
jgi:hypothetical protein